jgi:hypothetical protein
VGLERRWQTTLSEFQMKSRVSRSEAAFLIGLAPMASLISRASGTGIHESQNQSLGGFTLFATDSFAQVDVSASGGTANASYTTLKGAFDAIKVESHTGTISIGISANTTEPAAAVLNASRAGAASSTSASVEKIFSSTQHKRGILP